MARNGFASAMEGFNFGVNAVRQYQDAKLEADAGDAYKNTKPTTATTSDFGKVEQDGLYQGPNSDGVMTNAEAASYGLMEPKKTTTDYTLGDKTQQTQFTDSQIEAARTRAGADVYANAGRMKEASAMRRDAAQLGLTEMQMTAAQRENEQGITMDAKTAAMPTIGGYHKDGAPVDLAARQAAFEADGMSPEEAKKASTSGLRQTTQADQQSYLASVYLAGGHKYLPQYGAAIKAAATERSNQVRRDINKATTIEAMNAAYGHIDDGKSIRSVPQLDAKGKPTGKFQIEAFDTATGRGAGLIQQGKVYESLDQFKADSNVMMNENPDAFVAHEQSQAQRAMEQAKITEEARKNKEHERLQGQTIKIAGRQADTAASVAESTIRHNTLASDVIQTGLDTTTAFGTPAEARTQRQDVMVAGVVGQANAKGNTPEKRSTARKSAESYTEKILKSDGPFAKYSDERQAEIRAGMTAAGEYAAIAQSTSASREVNESKNHQLAMGAVEAGKKLMASGAVPKGTSLEDATLQAIQYLQRETAAPKPAAAAGVAPVNPASAPKPAAGPGKYRALWQ